MRIPSFTLVRGRSAAGMARKPFSSSLLDEAAFPGRAVGRQLSRFDKCCILRLQLVAGPFGLAFQQAIFAREEGHRSLLLKLLGSREEGGDIHRQRG